MLAFYLPPDVGLATDAARRAGFGAISLLYSPVTGGLGVLTWCFLPAPHDVSASAISRDPGEDAFAALRRPIVWA
jgi:hypothetical protein